MIGIYKITNPKGAVYVGQSNDIDRRWKDYKNLRCKSQQRIYNSLFKYGVETHTFEVIEECETGNLNLLESKWIWYYKDSGCDMLNIVGYGERNSTELTLFLRNSNHDEIRAYLDAWHNEINYSASIKDALEEIHNEGFYNFLMALINASKKGLIRICGYNKKAKAISIDVLNTRHFFNHNLRNSGEFKKWEEIVKACNS